jgi:hypothetical protein
MPLLAFFYFLAQLLGANRSLFKSAIAAFRTCIHIFAVSKSGLNLQAIC